jgi:hypothetical protein
MGRQECKSRILFPIYQRIKWFANFPETQQLNKNYRV